MLVGVPVGTRAGREGHVGDGGVVAEVDGVEVDVAGEGGGGFAGGGGGVVARGDYVGGHVVSFSLGRWWVLV